MGYNPDIFMWNHGLMDSWNTARAGELGMAYFNKTDIPYYHALADAFTIGD
jgi:phospholipase C